MVLLRPHPVCMVGLHVFESKDFLYLPGMPTIILINQKKMAWKCAETLTQCCLNVKPTLGQRLMFVGI